MKNLKEAFLEKAKDFVENYDIDDTNKDAIEVILKYFAGINTKKYPLNKGLLIHGCIGSGKTITLKIIQQLVKNFSINNIRDVVADFNIGGFDAIDSLVKNRTRAFDDIGQENNGKFYANETNVVQELIIRRYERFQNSGQITHFTTNFGTKEHFIKRYGKRAFDRLTEMCSSVILGDNDISRRDKYNPIDKNKPKQPDTLINEEKANREATIRSIKKIYNGEDVLNAMYVNAYNYLKKNGKLLLSDQAKNKIIIDAKKMLAAERQSAINKLTNNGNLSTAKNLAKKEFDVSGLIVFQKKIAVIEFLQAKKEFDIPINEIIN